MIIDIDVAWVGEDGTHKTASRVQNLLTNFDTYSRQMKSAIALYEFSKAEHELAYGKRPADGREAHRIGGAALQRISDEMVQYHDWKAASARETIFQAKHLAFTLWTLGKVIESDKKMKADANCNAIAEAVAMFDAGFLSAKSFRDAIAHNHQHFADGKGFEKHALKLDGGGLLAIVESFMGDVFTTTFDGRQLNLEISTKLLGVLDEVKHQLYLGFEPIEKPANKLHRAFLAERQQ